MGSGVAAPRSGKTIHVGPAYPGYCLLGITTGCVVGGAAKLAGLPLEGGWLEYVIVALTTGIIGVGCIAFERRGDVRRQDDR
jgi:hypothetical protein